MVKSEGWGLVESREAEVRPAGPNTENGDREVECRSHQRMPVDLLRHTIYRRVKSKLALNGEPISR